jgi:hypothetical protein
MQFSPGSGVFGQKRRANKRVEPTPWNAPRDRERFRGLTLSGWSGSLMDVGQDRRGHESTLLQTYVE